MRSTPKTIARPGRQRLKPHRNGSCNAALKHCSTQNQESRISDSRRFLLSQAHPTLRKYDGISWVLRVKADGGGESETAGVKIDQLAEIGYILRSLVGHSGNVVLVN